jgi:hypothetical protein
MRANAFFNQHFGGSTYLQVAVEAKYAKPEDGQRPIGEPTVLREIRDIDERVRAIPGVVDVRTIVDPVVLLNEALGGRNGIPETPGRAGRVLTYLQGHPAVAQLITSDSAGALVHIKLAPMSGDEQLRVTNEVRAVLGRYTDGKLVIAPTTDAKVREVQIAEVGARLARLTGAEVDVGGLLAVDLAKDPPAGLVPALVAVRDRALEGDDSPVEGVPRAEIDAIEPTSLISPRGPALEALLREKLPTLAAKDPEGVGFVAKHLGPWVDEELAKVPRRGPVRGARQVGQGVRGGPDGAVGARRRGVAGDGRQRARDAAGDPLDRSAGDRRGVRGQRDAQPVRVDAGVGGRAADHAAGVSPAEGAGPRAVDAVRDDGGPVRARDADQRRHEHDLVHRARRGRRLRDPPRAAGAQLHGGRSRDKAVADIGVVTLISALQLALAFLVLVASEMAPLREFGIGLAIGLVGAALGACWLVPWLYRGKPA